MNATFKFDLRDFESKMRKCVEISHRAPAEVINSHAFAVAKKAMEETPIASRGQIQQRMGAEIVRQRIDKKGKVRRKYNYKPTKLVYLLINARQKKLGRAPFVGARMGEAARKFISGKLRAIGSLRSGWRGALRAFARGAHMAAPNVGPNVKSPGFGTPAKPGENPIAEFTYNLRIRKHGLGASSAEIDPRVVRATEKALAAESLEMQRHIDKRLQDEFNKL